MKEDKEYNKEESKVILNQGDGQALGMQTDYYLHEDVMNEPYSLKGSVMYTNDGYVILDGKIKMTREEFKQRGLKKKEEFMRKLEKRKK